MKNMRILTSFVVMAMLLLLVPFQVSGGNGAGIEPGVGCEIEGVKYDAPPYVGYIDVEWIPVNAENTLGNVYLSGTVERVGQMECIGDFDTGIEVTAEPISLATFQNIKSNDLRQTCISSETIEYFFCNGEPVQSPIYYEIIGAGNKTWLNEAQTIFRLHVVIMGLE